MRFRKIAMGGRNGKLNIGIGARQERRGLGELVLGGRRGYKVDAFFIGLSVELFCQMGSTLERRESEEESTRPLMPKCFMASSRISSLDSSERARDRS